jgi:hypothetical protein
MLAVRSEPFSAGSNSLITGKIEGISPILRLLRMPAPAESNGFAWEFPKDKTGNFLSSTGKLYAGSSETLRSDSMGPTSSAAITLGKSWSRQVSRVETYLRQ